MNSFKSLKQKLFLVNESNFEELALEVFHFQSNQNKVYNSYLNYLGLNHTNINSIYEIPFMPISFYKTQKVVTGEWDEVQIFKSSGTTQEQRLSTHYIRDLDLYHKVSKQCFNRFYGNLSDYIILALLPSYLEREGSSLIYMVDSFMKYSKPGSGFFLDNYEELQSAINTAKSKKKRILLIGVSFALLDLAEHFPTDLKDGIVMETGGMKGRRKEMVRFELHELLKKAFNVDTIHSEYGMTELMSQAYSRKDGYFESATWMKALARDLNDPFSYVRNGVTGGLNIIDLANLHSCSFLETEDIGRVFGDNKFEVLGRMDNSEIRGCNLLLSDG